MNFDPYNGSHFTLGANEYFEYSVGDGNWTRFTGTIENVAFGGSKGELRLRGKSSKGTADDSINYCYVGFGDSSPVKCYGDIRTLVDYKNYSTTNTDNVRFTSLFDGCKALISAPELPSTNLASYCYRWMFKDCSSLTAAPALPAPTLAHL